MLIMQPLRLKTQRFQFDPRIGKEEFTKMRNEILENFNKIPILLRQIPLPLVFVFR